MVLSSFLIVLIPFKKKTRALEITEFKFILYVVNVSKTTYIIRVLQIRKKRLLGFLMIWKRWWDKADERRISYLIVIC